MELTGGPGTGQQAHDQPQIEAGDMDQIAFMEVFAAAQPGAAHAATIEDLGEARSTNSPRSLNVCARHIRFQPRAVGVDCLARGLVAVPAQEPSSSGVRRCASSRRRRPERFKCRANDSPCRRPGRQALPALAPDRPRPELRPRLPASAASVLCRPGRPDGFGRDDAPVSRSTACSGL